MRIPVDVLVAAEQPLYVMGLQSVLASCTQALRCIAVHTANEVLAQVRRPGRSVLVIADHRFGGAAQGLRLLQQVGSCRPDVSRVLMTDQPDPLLERAARLARIDALLDKGLSAKDWVLAVDRVLQGGRGFQSVPATEPALGARQAAVLQLAAEGLGNRQIAARLNLTERTVKYHMGGVFQRLACATRTEAVAKAAAMGMITLQPPPPRQLY